MANFVLTQQYDSSSESDSDMEIFINAITVQLNFLLIYLCFFTLQNSYIYLEIYNILPRKSNLFP